MVESQVKEIKEFFKRALKDHSRSTLIPLFSEKIHAGFESPAADYEEARIDLNDYVLNYSL